MATTTLPTERRIVLHDVSWDSYESLLADHVNSSTPHFTYDRGELEILSPSTEHEEANRTLALLVEIVAESFLIDVRNVGSMTYKRQDLQRGFEPDSSFYIQQEAHIRGKRQIDLLVDPPPDLVVEIEITQPAIAKLSLYAMLGVPEIWRSTEERTTILQLRDGEYFAQETSMALTPLSADVLTRFMRESRSQRRTVWLRRVRDWAQRQRPSHTSPSGHEPRP